MKIIFTRTRYKNEGEPDVLSETLILPNDFKPGQIGKILVMWGADKGHGDYSWDYEEEIS